MKHLKLQNGQSSVEAALMSLILVTFVTVLFSSLYMVYASYWVEHIMYESLICYQEREHKKFCVNEAENKIRTILIFYKSFQIQMEVKKLSTVAKLEMKIKPIFLNEKKFSFKKELRI